MGLSYPLSFGLPRSLGTGLGSPVASPPVPLPPENPGLTPVSGFPVTFGAGSAAQEFKAANLGPFSAFPTGSMFGGLAGGVTCNDSAGVRRVVRAGVPFLDPAALPSSGTTTLDGTISIPGSPHQFIIGGFVKPAGGITPSNQIVAQLKPITFMLGINWLGFDGNGFGHFRLLDPNQTQDQTVTIEPDQWAQWWYVVRNNGDAGDFTELWVRTSSGGAAVRASFALFPGGLNFGYTGLQFTWPYVSNQSPFAGSLGPVHCYTYDTDAHARAGPGAVLWPDYSPTTYSVQAGGSDAAITGPWATKDGAITALNRNVVQHDASRPIYWAGMRYGRVNLPDRASRYALAKAIVQGAARQTGDVIRYTAPVTFRDTLVREWNQQGGVKWDFNGSLLLRTAPMNGTWTAFSSAGGVDTFRYDAGGTGLGGVVKINREVWGPNWESFLHANDVAGVQGGTYRQFTSPTGGDAGKTYISLPTGTTPGSLGTFEGNNGEITQTPNPELQWYGQWVKGVTTRGGRAYVSTSVNQSYDFAANAGGTASDGSTVTVFENCIAERYGKHAFAITGNGLDEGLYVTSGCGGRYGPPDANYANYEPFAEYTAHDASAIAPGQGVVVHYLPVNPGGLAEEVQGTTGGRAASGQNVHIMHGNALQSYFWDYLLVVTLDYGQFLGDFLLTADYPPNPEYGTTLTSGAAVLMEQRAALP